MSASRETGHNESHWEGGSAGVHSGPLPQPSPSAPLGTCVGAESPCCAASPLSLPSCVAFLVVGCLDSDFSRAPQVIVETDCVSASKEPAMGPDTPEPQGS